MSTEEKKTPRRQDANTRPGALDSWRSWRLGVSILPMVLAACSVDTEGYKNRLYTCDVTSLDTAACGAGYGCYGAARQLGAPDFCAPTCDSGTPAPSGQVCTESSLLDRCDPTAGGGCPAGMNCIRTDLISNEGVCLPISPCTKNADCKDPVLSECFSTEM